MRFSSGPRAGELIFADIVAVCRDNGFDFTNCINNNGGCGPGRAELWTSKYRHNHQVGPGNTTEDYYDFYRSGKKASTMGYPAKWKGPHLVDLAAQGAADREVGDDLEYATGGMTNFLGDVCTVGYMGKFTNGHGDDSAVATGRGYDTPAETYLYVPPGLRWSRMIIGDDSTAEHNGGVQDRYHTRVVAFEGDNPADGNGAAGVEEYYAYDRRLTAASWSGGFATFTYTIPAGITADMIAGDEVIIEGVTNAAYNDTFTVVDKPTATTFRVAMAVNPGTTTVPTAARAYVTKFYQTNLFATFAIEFMQGRSEEEPWLLFIADSAPHNDTDSDTTEVERKYIGTVDPADFSFYEGVAGATNPAVIAGNQDTTFDAGFTAAEQWQQRAESLASVNDQFVQVVDAATALGWAPTLIFTSDNGFQQGEHEAIEGDQVWTNADGKGYVWNATLKLPFWVRDAQLGVGSYDGIVMMVDVLPTLLDLFARVDPALLDHHVHQKRDGMSMFRQLADGDGDRAPLFYGLTQGRLSDGIIVPSKLKLFRDHSGPFGNAHMYDIGDDPNELSDLVLLQPTDAARLAGYIPTLRQCTWNDALGRNTCRDART